MPVDYIGLRNQINSMGEDALSRNTELERLLKQYRAVLDEKSDNLFEIQRIVEEAATKNKHLRCAVPVNEPLVTHITNPLSNPPATVISADGSQIIPDPHDSVFYGLVNIGLFTLHPGSGTAPVETVESTLLFGDNLETPEGIATEDLVSLLRDVMERQKLVQIVHGKPSPVVTLTDGPLELFHQPRNDKKFEQFFKKYLAALDDLALENVITAGYTSRPRAGLVSTMLSLFIENPQPVPAITDIVLYEHLLLPGERSAIFKLQSSSVNDYSGRKALHFFYLNAGTAMHPAFARVEIPLWVAEDKAAINTLHSLLVEQSLQAGANPYPYPLLRAHEIAVVKMPEKQQLTNMIQAELLRRGFHPKFKSEKQSNKDLSGKQRLK